MLRLESLSLGYGEMTAVHGLTLNVKQEFMNRFSAAKFLPHTDPKRFPSVKPLKIFGSSIRSSATW
jgi:hypothetical protein